MNRQDFPILNEQVYGKPLIYFDNAATSQKPQQVIDAITYAYSHFNANIHRGVHHLSQVATQQHEKARQTVAQFINAPSANSIIFTKGTTDAINMLAFSFGEYQIGKGDEIIVSQLEHHSNIVPWQMLCERKGAVLRVIPLQDNQTLDIAAFEAMLNVRTRLVSVAHVSNVLGIINPIRRIIKTAHKHNIPVCIDAAQSAPHMPLDVRELDCDFLALSAHKTYGPTGIGVLYGKEQWLNLLPPPQGGGEMIEHVTFEKTTYNTLPYKFEAGTPNYIGSYAFMKAIEYIENIGMDKIHAHEQALTRYAEQRLKEIAGLNIYAVDEDKAGVISFNAEGIHPYDIGVLLDQQGIAVRTGHHCAEPLIEYLGVAGTVRISFGLYNTQEEVDTFIGALKRALSMLR
ncbi:MAG: cysteine desulfurase [Paludibacter sp.]|nr:cysteine desulfurase [Bacteroidales bacterium]MCM1068415.1 cysteine desulfurase [Prevotella sp.]MCM1353370.1 cysteine desulfurase [Bacteroides sp.]MCM1442531.1 cysteine desulfurase [Muribaculum sp.]MCM1481376.1 cysteine desulfurase [Paludibacter sp.]